MMILALSWRNVWRHPLRSGTLVVAIMLGIAAGVFMTALSEGMISQRFKTSIERRLSHIQIHHKSYRSDQEVGQTIPSPKDKAEWLRNNLELKGLSSRTLMQAMVASAGHAGGVTVFGIDPTSEIETTHFDSFMTEGNFLDEDARMPIIIGQKLAKKLNVRLRSRVVLTFQNEHNELISAAFRVNGFYKSSNAQLDETQVFVRQSDIQKFLSNTSSIHEIAFLLQDGEQTDAVAAQLSEMWPDVEVATWKDLSPELRYMLDQGALILYIFMTVILLGIGFGILNTMLMVVFERTREIGMMMAIGMNRLRVFSMILIETVILSFIGGSLGLLVSKITVDYVAKVGLDLSSIADALAEFGYDAIVYPELSLESYFLVSVMIFLTAILASIYPAWKAIRLLPADAVRS